MRLIKCFVVFGLSFLTGTCGLPSHLDIDIGDYNNQLEAWNSQNMLDYQMVVSYRDGGGGGGTVISVKNGIPESYTLPEKVPGKMLLTVPEYYSFIKEREKAMKDWHKETTDSYSLKVRYDTTYHYPCEIVDSITRPQLGIGGNNPSVWKISVRPVTWETEAGNGEK
jgi:hypothetical protein